jgi:cytochrome c-type biogenesis protein CcsB
MAWERELAAWSNWATYASMLVWSLAFISFAVSFATVRASRPARRELADVTTAAGSVQSSATVGLLDQSDDDAQDVPIGVRSANIAMSLSWLATLLLAVGLVLRGIAVQRWPLGNMYEFSLASGLALALAFLVLALRHDLRWLGVLVSAFVLLVLGLAVTVLYTESAPLVPALDSYWLVIHVSAAVISGGAFSVGAALAICYLFAERAERLGASAGLSTAVARRLPPASRLDLLSYRVHAFVFPLWTFAIIAGAIWAEAAWSRYWGWDPKETWAFITWVCYAGYLHARATAGWKGRRAAVIALVAFGTFLFNYFGVNMLFGGLHSYSGL